MLWSGKGTSHQASYITPFKPRRKTALMASINFRDFGVTEPAPKGEA